MKVRELIEKLQGVDPEATVGLITFEDHNLARGVKFFTPEMKLPYAKGDNIRFGDGVTGNIVYISDEG